MIEYESHFTDNSGILKKEFEKAEKEALERIGQFVENEAKNYAPVDTGRLRASITHQTQEKETIIGTNVEYAEKMELGGSKQAPNGLLGSAINNNQSQIKQIIENVMKKH